jgi:hypothetical protein
MDQKPVSESHATLRKPGSCRETGEEPLREQPLPLGDQMQQLPRAAKQLLALRAAELVRCHGPHEAVACGAGVMRLDLLAALGQRGAKRSQPAQHAPDGTVVQRSFFDGRRLRLIADHSSSGTGRLTVGLPVVLQVAGGKVQEGPTGVTLIRKYESRDNR